MTYYTTLETILKNATSLLDNISDAEFRNKPNPDKWSKLEILGHLVDSGRMNLSRFEKSLLQENLVFDGYDQDDQVEKNEYQKAVVSSVINSWKDINEQLAKILASIPNGRLNAETTDHNFDQIAMNRVSKGELSSLNYFVWDYIFHLEHHVQQICEGYKRVLGPFKNAIN